MNAKTPRGEESCEGLLESARHQHGLETRATCGANVARVFNPCVRRRSASNFPSRRVALAFVLLFPLLCIAADAPAPFENEIRAFEQADAKSPPPKDAVLFL